MNFGKGIRIRRKLQAMAVRRVRVLGSDEENVTKRVMRSPTIQKKGKRNNFLGEIRAGKMRESEGKREKEWENYSE